MTSHKIGVNLRVSGNCNQGGRRYMEDTHAIRFIKKDGRDYDFAYFGIFDGHGGPEASKHARDHLLDEITKYSGFWTDNDDEVLSAIKSGFLDTHYSMWKELANWPNTVSGLPSTSGTTASVAIIKNAKLYIGHVGDSGIVLGFEDKSGDSVVTRARNLTIDHKPDNPVEKLRIEESGGAVVAKAGVQRVVWNRPKPFHKGPIRRSTQIDKIPFLAVARSLGDLWSYDYYTEKFVVSPEPDVSVIQLDPRVHKCLVLASDGLWNMIGSEESVTVVTELEAHFEEKVITDTMVPVSYWINPAERLVTRALNKWRAKMMKADNTTCVVVLIDPLGPSKLTLLRRKREEHLRELAEQANAQNVLASRVAEGLERPGSQDRLELEGKAARRSETEVGQSSSTAVIGHRHSLDRNNCVDRTPPHVLNYPQGKPRRPGKMAPLSQETEDSVQATSSMLKDSTASNLIPSLLPSSNCASSTSSARASREASRFDPLHTNTSSSAQESWRGPGGPSRVSGSAKLPPVFPPADSPGHCLRTASERTRSSLFDGSNKLPPVDKAFKFTPDSENKLFCRDSGRLDKERTFTRDQSSNLEKNLPFPRDHNNSNINSPPRLRSSTKCKQNIGFAKRTRTMLRKATEAARKAMFPENRLFHTPTGCSPVGVKRRQVDSVASGTPRKRPRRSLN